MEGVLGPSGRRALLERAHQAKPLAAGGNARQVALVTFLLRQGMGLASIREEEPSADLRALPAP